MSASQNPFIAALLREREGYVRYGKPERVKAVDAELKRLGHKDSKKSEPKERTAPEAKKATADAPVKKTAAKS